MNDLKKTASILDKILKFASVAIKIVSIALVVGLSVFQASGAVSFLTGVLGGAARRNRQHIHPLRARRAFVVHELEDLRLPGIQGNRGDGERPVGGPAGRRAADCLRKHRRAGIHAGRRRRRRLFWPVPVGAA